MTDSPVVALNRAVAIGERDGPEAALPMVMALAHHAGLARGHRLAATRALPLQRLGRIEEAVAALEEAVGATPAGAERDLLTRRLTRLRPASPDHARSEPTA